MHQGDQAKVGFEGMIEDVFVTPGTNELNRQ